MLAWILAALSGLVLISAGPPFPYTWLVWVSYVPLLWAARQASPRRALLLGWLSGTATYLVGYWFLYRTIVLYSAIPAAGAFLLTALMAAQQGLATGLWLALARFLDGRAPRWLLYPACVVALEYLYPTLFPTHLANWQYNCLWTSQCIEIFGVYGLSFAIVSVHVALWSLAEERRPRADLLVGPALLVALLGYGAVRVPQVEAQMASAPKLKIAMIESGYALPTSLRDIEEGRTRLHDMASDAVRAHHPDLLIFPESAVKGQIAPCRVGGEMTTLVLETNRYPTTVSYIDPKAPNSPQSGSPAPVLFGATTEDPDHDGPIAGRRARLNSAVLLDAGGNVLGKAFKNHLLPIGETIPGAGLFPWIYTRFLTRASVLTAGTEPGILPFQGRRIGVTICYEDLLPGFSYQLGRRSPDLLVNLTNDGWFGKTNEPGAHLGLAQARCLELRRYMARSTSTGITAVIDPLGRVVQATHGSPDTLVAEVGWMEEATPYMTIGPLFAWVCVAVCLFLTRRPRPTSLPRVGGAEADEEVGE